MTLIISLLALLVSFYLLAVVCDEFFIESLDIIARKLRLNSEVAGATFMAIGSSAPELFTVLIAVLKPGGHADIGVGTIVGSAIFNILVIIGASALFKKAKLTWQPVMRDLLFYCLSIILLLVSFWDGVIRFSEALLFVGLYVAYLIAVVNWRRWFRYSIKDPIEIVEKEVRRNPVLSSTRRLLSWFIPRAEERRGRYIVTFALSITLIAALSYVLVESAVVVGTVLGVSSAIIALTVLAAGTSIPDLISSVIVAKSGRGDMAIANAVGSNIFDILFGLGMPWLLILLLKGGAIAVSTENLMSSIFLLFATVLAVLFILLVKQWRIGRRAGVALIALYFLYILYAITQTLG